MRLDSLCSNLVEFDVSDDCPAAVALAEKLSENGKVDIIGGGSNIVFNEEYHGTLIHPAIMGWVADMLDNGEVEVTVGAGVELDAMVSHLSSSGFWGLENLSGIPGTVGGATVQNAGAYGVEFGNYINYVHVWNCKEHEFEKLSRDELHYGYRHSLFKEPENEGKYIVLEVSIVVSKKNNPQLNYGPLRNFESRQDLTPCDIRDAIIEIRNSKLPKVDEVGSAGSYFKNPVLSNGEWADFCKKLKSENVEITSVPHFILADSSVKIPAAWLIEQCGWKGRKSGNAGVWHLQPLILVNATGNATSTEIVELERAVIADVKKRFGIVLKPEVVRL